MSRKTFSLVQLAEQELIDAAVYYYTQSQGLEKEFLAAFEKCVEKIKTFPDAWPPFVHNIRRCKIPRFPYRVCYVSGNSEIIGLAIEHTSREPLYWIDRL